MIAGPESIRSLSAFGTTDEGLAFSVILTQEGPLRCGEPSVVLVSRFRSIIHSGRASNKQVDIYATAPYASFSGDGCNGAFLDPDVCS
jgi:hypothetical protein